MHAMMIAALAAAALAGARTGATATVNSYTPAQADHARQEARGAGYIPEAIAAAQDGNFFLTAERGGEIHQVTVTPSGKVYGGTGIKAGA